MRMKSRRRISRNDWSLNCGLGRYLSHIELPQLYFNKSPCRVTHDSLLAHLIFVSFFFCVSRNHKPQKKGQRTSRPFSFNARSLWGWIRIILSIEGWYPSTIQVYWVLYRVHSNSTCSSKIGPAWDGHIECSVQIYRRGQPRIVLDGVLPRDIARITLVSVVFLHFVIDLIQKQKRAVWVRVWVESNWPESLTGALTGTGDTS